MIFKKRGDKRGVFSVEIVLGFAVSILIVVGIVFVMVSQTKLTEGRAFMSYSYMRDEVVLGSDIFYIDAVDGRNGYLDNGTMMIRLSPTSGAINLNKTILRITTMTENQIYSFGGIGKDKSQINLTAGTASYGIEFLTKMKDVHNDMILNSGETIRLFYKFPNRVEEDTTLIFSIYPQNGRPETKKIKVPAAIRAERTQLFP